MTRNLLLTLYALLILIIPSVFSSESIKVPDRIFKIVQDNDGLIWLASSHSIHQYDGHELKSLFEETRGIPKQIIHSVTPSGDGVLISGAYGVYHINSDLNISWQHTTSAPVKDAIRYHNIIYYLTDSNLTVIENDERQRSIPISRGRELKLIGDRLYYRTREMFCEFEGNCIEGTYSDVAQAGDYIVLVSKDGLNIFNHDLTERSVYPMANVTYISEAVDELNNTIWVQQDNVVHLFDVKQQHIEGKQVSRYSDDFIKYLFQSREGILWIASKSVELVTIPFYSTEPYKAAFSHEYQPYLSWHNGDFYSASIEGLLRYNRDTYQVERIENAPTYIFNTLDTPEGLWLASFYGLYLYRNGTIKDVGLNGMVSCIHIENNDYLLVCNGGKVARINRKDLVYADDQRPWDETISNEVTNILPGSPRFVGTESGLISMADNGEVHYLLEGNNINSLYRLDNQTNNLLVTTPDGIYILDKQGKITRKFNNLKSFSNCYNPISANNYIWLNCKGGLTRLDTKDFSFSMFPVNGPVSNIYQEKDVLYAILDTGQLISWPASLISHAFKPQLLISKFLVNGKSGQNTIGGDNHVEIYATLNDYHQGNEYAFALNGQPLRDFSQNNAIGFNPSYGNNSVEITGTNHVGKSATNLVEFYVEYPMYMRWWAWMSYVVAIIFIVSYVRYRIRQKQYQEKLEQDLVNEKRLLKRERLLKNQIYFRTRFVPGFHRAIDEKINAVQIPWHDAKQIDKLKQLLADGKEIIPEPVYQQMADMVSLFDERASILHRHPDTSLEELMKIWEQEQHRKLGSTVVINLTWAIQTIFPRHVTSYLFFISQKLGGNACYKSGAEHVDICMEEVGEHIIIAVKDDGSGFNEDEHQDGATLYWIRTLVEWLGGNIEFHYKGADKGTEICIWLDNENLLNHDPNPANNQVTISDDFVASIYAGANILYGDDQE